MIHAQLPAPAGDRGLSTSPVDCSRVSIAGRRVSKAAQKNGAKPDPFQEQ